MSEPSWSDIGQQAQVAVRSANPEFDAACARIFISPDGKALLQELRRQHFEDYGNPMADDRALRVRATKQQFVRDLEIARDRGLAATANRKE